MSRSGYNMDGDGDQWGLIRWRGAVTSAIRGKRGQLALQEIAAALDALPTKELAAHSLVTADGGCCTLGALGIARGLDLTAFGTEDTDEVDMGSVANAFGIAPALAREIVFENDEGHWKSESPRDRWLRMRSWVSRHLDDIMKPPEPAQIDATRAEPTQEESNFLSTTFAHWDFSLPGHELAQSSEPARINPEDAASCGIACALVAKGLLEANGSGDQKSPGLHIKLTAAGIQWMIEAPAEMNEGQERSDRPAG